MRTLAGYRFIRCGAPWHWRASEHWSLYPRPHFGVVFWDSLHWEHLPARLQPTPEALSLRNSPCDAEERTCLAVGASYLALVRFNANGVFYIANELHVNERRRTQTGTSCCQSRKINPLSYCQVCCILLPIITYKHDKRAWKWTSPDQEACMGPVAQLEGKTYHQRVWGSCPS